MMHIHSSATRPANCECALPLRVVSDDYGPGRRYQKRFISDGWLIPTRHGVKRGG
jgi:hypothetical protein